MHSNLCSLLQLTELPPLHTGRACIFTIKMDRTANKVTRDTVSILTGQEQKKAAAFRFRDDRIRFIVTRSLLRKLLAHYLFMNTADIRIDRTPTGKPAAYSQRHEALPVKFNVTHSGNIALIALTPDKEVGIDVEQIRDIPERNALVDMFFSRREQEQYRNLPEADRLNSFYRCWTGKEAFVKATGEGLNRNLHSFDIDYANHSRLRIISIHDDTLPPASRWHMKSLTPAPGYVGACVLHP